MGDITPNLAHASTSRTHAGRKVQLAKEPRHPSLFGGRGREFLDTPSGGVLGVLGFSPAIQRATDTNPYGRKLNIDLRSLRSSAMFN